MKVLKPTDFNMDFSGFHSWNHVANRRWHLVPPAFLAQRWRWDLGLSQPQQCSRPTGAASLFLKDFVDFLEVQIQSYRWMKLMYLRFFVLVKFFLEMMRFFLFARLRRGKKEAGLSWVMRMVIRSSSNVTWIAVGRFSRAGSSTEPVVKLAGSWCLLCSSRQRFSETWVIWGSVSGDRTMGRCRGFLPTLSRPALVGRPVVKLRWPKAWRKRKLKNIHSPMDFCPTQHEGQHLLAALRLLATCVGSWPS